MFSRILIANRGEIACRIIRTARRMGMSTVAVHSEPDRHALHVRMADAACEIGPAPAAESYLSVERILDAARGSGAQAIHPGYGFLAENANFAAAVEAAGLIFVGPAPASMEAMAMKDAAKHLMQRAGVPVVPGYHGAAQDLVVLATQAREIGYPVLIKARAGGGGKGMRKVERPEDFAEALAACRREAKASFGDEGVLIEKFIARARHIEVQVFGDGKGHAVHLFERDCSAQRRHQKVIEEAPAPGMTGEMREAICSAAVRAAEAISYRGAGTIEFIADASEGLRPDRFWFMEMNTRLQVEHPATEMITGIDLVEWQLRIAAGEALPLRQDEIAMQGHAFEARIYAEDPEKGFLPSTGKLHVLRFPDPGAGDALRIETGVTQGDWITPWYDPMIAKLVVRGEDRQAALEGLAAALSGTRIAGSRTNLAFLHALATNPAFAEGTMDTGWIEREGAQLTARSEPGKREMAQAFAFGSGFTPAPAEGSPWEMLKGYAHFHPLTKEARLQQGERMLVARLRQTEPARVAVEIAPGEVVTVPLDAETDNVSVWPEAVAVFDGPHVHEFRMPEAGSAGEEAEADMRAPMPGLVKLVHVRSGQAVAKGQPLLVLEAMKMEHAIAAPRDGTIGAIVAEGAQVAEGTALVRYAEDAN